MTSTASEFRAKVAQMKAWKPASVPSNRDRLDLYALHKQAVSGDAPESESDDTNASERAKSQAWRTKRGMSQSEAMTAYVAEANRQLRVYGTTSTPTNTPAVAADDSDSSSSGILLTPRGLAAVPLLCAAASESRAAYLSRLASSSSGWWHKQEPLCADPGTPLAFPESVVIFIASKVESLSLLATIVQKYIPPSVLQSFLWPLHNVLLVVWLLVIFISTLSGTCLLTLKTTLLGSKRTGASLHDLWNEEFTPCRNAILSLLDPHQVITIKILGLLLYPCAIICQICESLRDIHVVLGSIGFVIFFAATWWYWFLVLPWVVFWSSGFALAIGWCFSLMELAGF